MRYLLTFIFGIIFLGCENPLLKKSANNNDESLYYQQWHMDKNDDFYRQNGIDSNAHIQPDTNTYKTYTGRGVTVAVIDDGFDTEHPEIKDNIIATFTLDRYGDIVSNDASHTFSSDFHGTAVTGIIGSADDEIGVRGIAPDVNLILIKMPRIFTDIGVKKLFDIAVENGADIINCSWGTGSVSDTVRDHIDNNISVYGRNGKGAIVVFAAGNQNKKITNDESSIETVIGVGATGKDNLRLYQYTNYGKELDIMAPGGYEIGITTLDPIDSKGVSEDEYNRYDEYKDGISTSFIGTSAAAPIITGTIALLLEKNPNLTRSEIQELLKVSTDTVGLNTPYIDEMISSSSQTPTIRGLLGTSGNADFYVFLQSNNTNNSYGPYSLVANGDGTFYSTATDTIPEGNYTIELVDTSSNNVFATDSHFEINISKSDEYNSSIRKSDYYGYGKINLGKLLQN